MTPELTMIYDAAMKLPPEQRRELISKLTYSTPKTRAPGILRKYFGMIDSGDPNSASNDKIDIDLIKAYTDSHDPEN